MHFTPSRSKVSTPPHSLPQHCRSPIVPCTPSLPPLSLHPPPQGPERSLPLAPTSAEARELPPLHCPALPWLSRHSSSCLKVRCRRTPPTPFFYGERCLTLLQMMNTVCARFKEFLFNCSLPPFFSSHLPMPTFSLGFWGAIMSI